MKYGPRGPSFFFQAEDGIRDSVASRGLGDVYKRQGDPPSPMTPILTFISPVLNKPMGDISGRYH